MMKSLVITSLGKLLRVVAPKVAEKVADRVLSEETLDLVTTLAASDDTIKAEDLIALKQAIADERSELREEMANARAREIQLAKTPGGIIGIWTQNGGAALAIIMFMACLGMLFFIEIPAANEKLIYYVLGILSAVMQQIYSYWFGSSLGSKEKDTWIKHHS